MKILFQMHLILVVAYFNYFVHTYSECQIKNRKILNALKMETIKYKDFSIHDVLKAFMNRIRLLVRRLILSIISDGIKNY